MNKLPPLCTNKGSCGRVLPLEVEAIGENVQADGGRRALQMSGLLVFPLCYA